MKTIIRLHFYALQTNASPTSDMPQNVFPKCQIYLEKKQITDILTVGG